MVDIGLTSYLTSFLTERRKQLIENVLHNRTRYVTLVLEDIYQSQNASAVMRTCECLGLQDIHVVENKYNYQYNPDVAMGAGKWTSLIKHQGQANNTRNAIHHLRCENYRIIATAPGGKGIPLSEFDVTKGKFAIAIGSELNGLSDEIMEQADECITIPMYGFTESFNLSVSAALILYELVHKIRQTDIHWHLREGEIEHLRFEWVKSSVRKPDLLIKKYYEVLNHNLR
jgi:tRNA (guanosine-2'-O-)-methyltransferase